MSDLNDGIEWIFIHVRFPQFGGLWEARLVAEKFHFFTEIPS